MASLAMTVVEEAAKKLSLHQAISGIFGSISMAAWICVILPQMIVNYRAKSADGLSITFLAVWMLGDATNLIGGLLTNLAPTAVALAMYFCVADFLLISQCLYYNTVNARRAALAAEENEEAPLLGERHHRRSVSSEDGGKIGPAGDELLERSTWMSNTASLIGVYVAGFIGWYLSYKAGAYREADPVVFNAAMQASPDLLEKIGIVLGYFSAICYLCARVPQIIKNYREKSCEGLSILFFMLSLTGNLTYAVSIVAYSQERKYIINTIPWLIGSLGTVVEDGTIFVQFRLYANNRRSTQA
ncbi:hypothetical protein ACHAPE_002676 [Trichoderma viride]